ncbi:MAG: hypothetical protein MdMp014T_2318 [Treponematales bacterium]
MRGKVFVGCICLAGFLLACSCRDKGGAKEVFAPPSTSPLSSDCVGYGVVTIAFIETAALPAESGGGEAHGRLRRGDVVKVTERRVFRDDAPEVTPGFSLPAEGGLWVCVEAAAGDGEDGPDASGWLPAQIVDIYGSEAQARTASKSLGQ